MSSYVQLLKWTVVVVYVLCIVLERMVPFDAPLLTFLDVTQKLVLPACIQKESTRSWVRNDIGLTGLFCQVLERMVPFDAPLLTLLDSTNKVARVASPII